MSKSRDIAILSFKFLWTAMKLLPLIVASRCERYSCSTTWKNNSRKLYKQRGCTSFYVHYGWLKT